MARLERTAMVVTPLVAMATLALGLRVGAARAAHAAVVYGAPRATGRSGLALQLVTLLDDRGVREAVSIEDLSMVARRGGAEARWSGSTNADGVAEVWLDLPDVARGDTLSVSVDAKGERAPLAEGSIVWGGHPWNVPLDTETLVRPSKREGALGIDVAVYGTRLAPGYPESVWVRVVDRATGAPQANAMVTAEPEPGVTLHALTATTCEEGWAELRATSETHVAALGLKAASGGGKQGEWFGSLPVAPGAFYVPMTPRQKAGESSRFIIHVPTTRRFVYAEIDDPLGRDLGAILVPTDVDGDRQAVLDVPPLGPGAYWLVTAGDPRGAENLGGAALARPFLVGEAQGSGETSRCKLGSSLARRAATGFPRFVALDGVPTRRARDGSNHARGLFIAFASLATAALLEALLILRAAARARAEIGRVAAAMEGRPDLSKETSAGSVVIGVLLALLGFGLIAALLTWRAA